MEIQKLGKGCQPQIIQTTEPCYIFLWRKTKRFQSTLQGLDMKEDWLCGNSTTDGKDYSLGSKQTLKINLIHAAQWMFPCKHKCS